MIGRRYGNLTVKRYAGSDNGNGALMLCICDCGSECVKRAHELKSGNTTSCGCGNDENRAKNMRVRSKAIHVNGTNLATIASDKIRPDNKTGVKGVYQTKSGRYKAVITFQGKTRNLGTFDELADAAEARREAELELFAPVLEAHGLTPESDDEYETKMRRVVESQPKD